MNSQQAKKFRERWQAVKTIEVEEQRAASIALRWEQTNAIFRLAVGLRLEQAEGDSAGIKAVCRRWALLREATT